MPAICFFSSSLVFNTGSSTLQVNTLCTMLSHVQLCDRVDCGPPGSSVHGISQARILEWVAISYSRGSSQPRDGTHISCISCIGKRMILYN